MDKYSALKQYFGHSEFRPGQEHLIDAVLSGRDVLGVMPTGEYDGEFAAIVHEIDPFAR